MLLLSLIILLFAAFQIWYRIKYRKQNYLISKIPGPKKWPIFHNTLQVMGKGPIEIFDWFEDLGNKYGRVYQFTTTPFDPGFAIISDVKIVESLLTSQTLLNKTEDYDLMVDWIGTGLLISTGKKWFQRRKLLTPGFHFQILEKFVSVMNEKSMIFVQQLAKNEGKPVDIFPMVGLLALDTICEASMGTNMNAQTTDSDYLRAVKEIAAIVTIRSMDEFKRNKFIFQFTEMYQREKNCLKILHDFVDKVIQKRRNELLNDQETVSNENSTKKKKALLDILLSSTVDGEPLNDLDIREEVGTFMFAGHDTTTSGISFTLYCIAKYQDVQQKIYEEVMEVIGNDENITTQKLNSLHYLDLVIKESLRLFPPVPYYGRKIQEEFSANGYTFPKGMNIYVSPYLMRNNEEWFSEPEKFNPYRFDVEKTYEKVNPFSFVPFSAGPRNCIGQKFAQYEIKTVVVNVVKNFKIRLADEQESMRLNYELILRPNNGINILIEKRS